MDYGGWASDSSQEITPRDSDRLYYEPDSEEEYIYNVPSDSDTGSVISERYESDYDSQYDSSDSNYELERPRLDLWLRFN